MKAFAWLLIPILVYFVFRFEAGLGYPHPDEVISEKVIERIWSSGEWDTNWALADLPEEFRYPQYNFSSYILFSAFLASLFVGSLELFGGETGLLAVLRILSALYHVVTIGLVYLFCMKHFRAWTTATAAALAVAVFPLLFQDSLYARPESFAAMLTMLVCLLLPRRDEKPALIRFAAAGFLIGILIGTKITFLSVMALPAVALWTGERVPGREACRLAGVCAAGILLGFVAGAPHAFLHWSAYTHGLSELFKQYSKGHSLHGLGDGTAWARLHYAWGYFSGTGAGLFIAGAAIGWVLLLRARHHLPFVLVGFGFSIVVFFSLRPVFFERNFSFVIPFLSVAVAFALQRAAGALSAKLKRPRWRYPVWGMLVVLVAAPPSLFLWKFASEVLPHQVEERAARYRLELVDRYGMSLIPCGTVTNEPHYDSLIEYTRENGRNFIYEFRWVNHGMMDHYQQRAIKRLNLVEIEGLPSPLHDENLPPCTMVVYHSPGYVFLVPAESAPRP